MASHWLSTVIDARDHRRLARWWAEVLDYRIVHESDHATFIADRSFPDLIVDGDDRFFNGPFTSPGLLFMASTESKAGKNRVHIDLNPHDQDAEVERLVDMGARHVDIGQRGVRWVVLADPEGNEF